MKITIFHHQACDVMLHEIYLVSRSQTIYMIERSDYGEQFKVANDDESCAGIVVVDRNEECVANCFRPSYPLTDLR